QLQGLHLQLEPQPQPWAVSPDSAAASKCAFSGATPSTTVAWALLLFSSRSGYIFLQPATKSNQLISI
ncbi:Os03g0288051, partial [Oryza sativa Japonica Group]